MFYDTYVLYLQRPSWPADLVAGDSLGAGDVSQPLPADPRKAVSRETGFRGCLARNAVSRETPLRNPTAA